jgi:L-aspartate semialdehyde sulfurtransferase
MINSQNAHKGLCYGQTGRTVILKATWDQRTARESMGSTQKTYHEINEKIRKGQAVVVTADEMVAIVRKKGPARAAREVDVVTTGTFAPMCSSGVFINFGHTQPPIKAAKVWLNGVPAYGGLAAVDTYLGATEPAADDPLNKAYPGHFEYGGGHVIQDLVSGKSVQLRAEGYGTDCYPNRTAEMTVSLDTLPYAVLVNPRNAYQNYNCAVNLSKKTIYTYMGTLKPSLGNANYSTSGQLSPLQNDPYYRTLGLGTRIFLGGAQGFIVWHGSQHNPDVERLPNGIPRRPAGTLMVMGDLKQMSPRWLMGTSILGYGCSLAVGLGVPIPVLDEEMATHTGVSDEDIVTQVKDYSFTRAEPLGEVSYAQLRSGAISVEGKQVQTVPLSSYTRAREIAGIMKDWILKGLFFLGEPQQLIPTVPRTAGEAPGAAKAKP